MHLPIFDFALSFWKYVLEEEKNNHELEFGFAVLNFSTLKPLSRQTRL